MNRHSLDAFSLVFGVVFLAAVGLWLVHRWVALQPSTAGWLLAVGLVVGGALGLLRTTRRDGADTPAR